MDDSVEVYERDLTVFEKMKEPIRKVYDMVVGKFKS